MRFAVCRLRDPGLLAFLFDELAHPNADIPWASLFAEIAGGNNAQRIRFLVDRINAGCHGAKLKHELEHVYKLSLSEDCTEAIVYNLANISQEQRLDLLTDAVANLTRSYERDPKKQKLEQSRHFQTFRTLLEAAELPFASKLSLMKHILSQENSDFDLFECAAALADAFQSESECARAMFAIQISPRPMTPKVLSLLENIILRHRTPETESGGAGPRVRL